MSLPFNPPAVGAAVVCFCVSYEGPMVPRSYRNFKQKGNYANVTQISYIQYKWSILDREGQTWGTPPLGPYFQDQVVLSPEKHLALYSRDKKTNRQN